MHNLKKVAKEESSPYQLNILNNNPIQERRQFALLSFDLLVITLFSIFMCLYKIGDGSFGAGDQTTHSLVIQEMNKSGDYLHPYYHGRLYYNKPPFKMWLVAAAVKILGESNFSYRVVDGLTGIAISLCLFLFARALFFSRVAGYFSCFALFSSRLFFYGHGVRNAVQDSMMIFLLTMGTICGWYLIEAIIKNKNIKYINRLSISGGVLIGLAALTKNVAGYFAYVIIGIYLLLTGKAKQVLQQYPWQIVSSILISLLLPTIFILAQGEYAGSAWRGLLISEVYNRAVTGFHHVQHHWLYWNTIIERRRMVPPELLFGGILFALIQIYRSKDRRYLFLLCWAVIPVLVQNAMKSKLEWYILPALPAMALLTGATIAQAINYSRNALKNISFVDSLKNYKLPFCYLFIFYSIVALGYSNYKIANYFLTAFRRNAADKIVEDIRNYGFANNKNPKIGFYHAPKLANHEMLYFAMAPLEQIQIKDLAQLKTLVENKEVDFVLTNKDNHKDVLNLGAEAVANLRKRDQRRKHLVILAFNKDIIPRYFKKESPQ